MTRCAAKPALRRRHFGTAELAARTIVATEIASAAVALLHLLRGVERLLLEHLEPARHEADEIKRRCGDTDGDGGRECHEALDRFTPLLVRLLPERMREIFDATTLIFERLDLLLSHALILLLACHGHRSPLWSSIGGAPVAAREISARRTMSIVRRR
ncbi:MAG TPA: hypothetical protein VGH63_09410 [Polyangia bacterium]